MKKNLLFLTLLTAGTTCFSQINSIPNAQFENWTGAEPDFWGTTNHINPSLAGAVAPAIGGDILGANTIVLTTKSIAGAPNPIPGIAVSNGMIAAAGFNAKISGGFPYTKHPIALKGTAKYIPGSGFDSAYVGIILTKWNGTSADTIGVGSVFSTPLTSTYASFEVRIDYSKSNGLVIMPDTAQIILSSSYHRSASYGNEVGSQLFVDNLQFAENFRQTETDSTAACNNLDPTIDLTMDINQFGSYLPESGTIFTVTRGQTFSKTITFYIPDSIIITNPISGTLYLDSVQTNNSHLSGSAAAFITATPGATNGMVKKNTVSCLTISGTIPAVTTNCQDSTFTLDISPHLWGTFPMFGPLADYSGSTTTYTFRVSDYTPPKIAFSSGSANDSICQNSCMLFWPTNNPCNAYDKWKWTFSGGTPSSAMGQSPGDICYNTPGVHIAKLVVSNTTNPSIKDSVTKTITVKANTLAVSFSGLNTKYCSNSASSTLAGTPSGGTYTGEAMLGNVFCPPLATSASSTILNESLQSVTYSYSDAFGCSSSSTQNTKVIIQASPTICMITVDDASNYNNVYWDKTPYSYIDSFIVYRETASNQYKRIGAVQNKELSMFIDTVRYKYFPFTGNPNAGTYRYKLQTVDSCGNYGPLSDYHNTIYINQNGGNFNWNAYQIENMTSPLAELSSYSLYRDANSTGTWGLINAVSGSQLTINDPDYLLHLNARYRIETDWSFNCVATRSASAPRSNSRKNDPTPTGITTIDNTTNVVSIYPNPSNGKFTVMVAHQGSPYQISITNVLGENIYNSIVNSDKTSIDLSNEMAGIYFIKIILDKEIITEKITLNK